MSKCYLDLGSNSLGAYKTLTPILGITNEWQKIFVEPNPEHWDGVQYFIDEIISKIPNAVLIKKAVTAKKGIFELSTRDDMRGDSAATILDLDFLETSIGSVNQAVPSYKSYIVDGITIEEIFKMTNADELYIKMDIEGSEFQVLDNFPLEYIPRIKRMFVEFHCHTDEMRERKYSLINKFKELGLLIENWD